MQLVTIGKKTQHEPDWVPKTCTCPQPLASCDYDDELALDGEPCTCCPRCRWLCYQDV